MNNVTHIMVCSEEVMVKNPYYSINNAGIESEYIKEFQQKVHTFYSEKEFKNYLKSNPHKPEGRVKHNFYRVEELYPKITTTVTIDV